MENQNEQKTFFSYNLNNILSRISEKHFPSSLFSLIYSAYIVNNLFGFNCHNLSATSTHLAVIVGMSVKLHILVQVYAICP